MRDAFNLELNDIAAHDPDVLLLTADIGFKVFDKFRECFPGRFINMGVAEANMMTVASGLAMSGKKPFVYTIIPFLTMRAFEQIRVDACIQKQPIKIIGVGGGVSYGILGPTHHSIEDVAILRALPNMTVIVPCDPAETRQAIRSAYEHPGPVYVRLGKNGEPVLPREEAGFRLGKASVMRQGTEAVIFVAGPVARVALEAAKMLERRGVSVKVLNLSTIKPIDRESILQSARETKAAVSVEEHNIIGGLGSAVAEVLAEGSVALPFKRIGIRDRFCYGVGSQEYHFKQQGLIPEAIEETILQLLNGGIEHSAVGSRIKQKVV